MSSDDRPQTLREYFLRGASGTMGLQACASALGIVISWLLARAVGAEGLGLYVYAIAWVGILSLPARLGLDRYLIREVPSLRTLEETGLLSGIISWSTRTVLRASILTGIFAAGIAWLVTGFRATDQVVVFWVCLGVLPVESLMLLHNAILRGFQRVVLAALPPNLFRPLSFTILLGLVILLAGDRFTPRIAAVLQIAAVTGAFLLSGLLLRGAVPAAVRTAEPRYRSRVWLRGAAPFLLMSGLAALNSRVDLIILGALRGPEEAGIYAVAHRGAGLLALVLLAANAPLAPLVSKIHVKGDYVRMQRVVTKTARAVTAVCIPLALLLILLREPLLRLFGAEFVAGEDALVVLCVGQLVNVCLGSVGVLLNMTGHERDVVKGFCLASLVNFAASFALIPSLGMLGAAIASSAGLVAWNLVLAVTLAKRTGLHTTALGPLGRKGPPAGP